MTGWLLGSGAQTSAEGRMHDDREPSLHAQAPSTAQDGPTEAVKQPRSTKKKVLMVVNIVLITALFAWVVTSIVADASKLDWSNLVRDPWALAIALVLWATAFCFRAWLWGEMMRRIGYRVGHLAGARVFFASHMGRFLPGKVWSVAGAGLFGKRYGLPPRASVVAMMVFLIIYYMVGSLLTLLVVWQLSAAHAGVAIAIAVGGLGLLVFLATPLFPALLRWLGNKFGRDMSQLRLPSAKVLVMVAIGLLAVWLAAGSAYVMLSRAVVPPEAGALGFVAGWGVYAAALVAGFAALFAPSGLGVREAVMLALLEPSLGAAFGGVVTIASRVLITSLELAFSLWGAWPALVERRKASR